MAPWWFVVSNLADVLIPSAQWPVRYPNAVLGFSLGLLFSGLAILFWFNVYVGLAAVLAGALPAVRQRALRCWRPGTLMHDQGGWRYACKGQAPRRLSLERAWLTAGWATLRFRSIPNAPEYTMPEITVWKSTLSDPAWRTLCARIGLGGHLPGGSR